MVVLVDNITLKIGSASDSKVDITNVEFFNYREVPEMRFRAITVMGVDVPLGFVPVPQSVEMEITVKSEAVAAMNDQGVDYHPTGATGPVIPYLVALIVDHAAASWTATFTGARVSSGGLAHGVGKEGMFTYKFVAISVVLVKV